MWCVITSGSVCIVYICTVSRPRSLKTNAKNSFTWRQKKSQLEVPPLQQWNYKLLYCKYIWWIICELRGTLSIVNMTEYLRPSSRLQGRWICRSWFPKINGTILCHFIPIPEKESNKNTGVMKNQPVERHGEIMFKTKLWLYIALLFEQLPAR